MSYICMCDKGNMYNQCLWKINCPLSQFTENYSCLCIIKVDWIRVITKLPNTEQSSKGKGKTRKSNRQNQLTTGKLGKPQWLRLGTGISKEMVGWIRPYSAKPVESDLTAPNLPLSLRLKDSSCHYSSILSNTGKNYAYY